MRAPGNTCTGPAGHHCHPVCSAQPEDGLDVGHRTGKDHGFRQLKVQDRGLVYRVRFQLRLIRTDLLGAEGSNEIFNQAAHAASHRHCWS